MKEEEDYGKHYFNATVQYINYICFNCEKRKKIYEKSLDILLDKYNFFIKEGFSRAVSRNKALFFSMDEIKKYLYVD